MSIRAKRTTPSVPLELTVSRNGGVAGLSPVVRVRDGATSNSYLDWSDNTFKTGGHTTLNGPMTDLGGGFYAASLLVSTFTNLPPTSGFLWAEFEMVGAIAGVTSEAIWIDDDAPAVTAAIAASDAKITQVLNVAINRIRLNVATQELWLYDAAGTTIVQKWPVSTQGGELVQTQYGVQVERGQRLL